MPGLLIRETASPESTLPGVPAQQLVEHLSFSHFAELLQLDDPVQRVFYEVEALRGNWSVRELKRQIATQYYQRTGLSTDKATIAALAHAKAEQATPQHIIRDPYVFEFLGQAARGRDRRPARRCLARQTASLLAGVGPRLLFCRAWQRRLLIGGEHFFVDLVFYHRVLKCHVPTEP